MLKIKPPTHKIDAGGVFISSLDCWDTPRIEAELAHLEAAALNEVQDKAVETFLAANANASDADVDAVRKACMLSDKEKAAAFAPHPVVRYRRGKTRFQPDAPDWDPSGKPTTARSYLTNEPTAPTEFVVRRLPFADVHRIAEISNTADRFTAWLKRGLAAVRSPSADYSWEAKSNDERTPDEVLQGIHEGGGLLLWTELAAAVHMYNEPLSDDESFR